MNSNLREACDVLVARKAQLLVTKRECRRDVRTLQKDIDNHIKARVILTQVGKLTQEKFKRRVESLVTLAIRSVFDREFDFILNFEEKNNQVTCTPMIYDGDKEYIPKDDMGGGIIDVVSFALRIVLWSMESPRSRNIFILDEPFKNTGALISKAGEMLKHLSSELNFQVILISHDEELINICDRVWRISHDGIRSDVKLIKGGRKITRLKLIKGGKGIKRR